VNTIETLERIAARCPTDSADYTLASVGDSLRALLAQMQAAQSPAPAAPAPTSQWQDIATAPRKSRTMFVVKAFDALVEGGRRYTSDPWCVWRPADGEFVRWPHSFPPTHWCELPPLSAAPEDTK
jgi:hypothetical protein